VAPANEHIARDAVKRGAKDYLLKSHLQQFRLRRVVSSFVKQHAAEEAAFFSQQSAEALLDCTAESALISDNTGHILRLNPAAEITTGWTRAEAVGRTLVEVFPVAESSPTAHGRQTRVQWTAAPSAKFLPNPATPRLCMP
jgi:PAS domain-containing protein